MSELIKVSWPVLGASVRIAPTEKNPHVWSWFTSCLPMTSVQLHTLVAGELLYWLNMPFTHSATFSEAEADKDNLHDEPVGRVTLFLTAGKAGGMCIKYGEVTEDMSYPTLGQVVEEDLAVLPVVGPQVWDNLIGPKTVILTELSLVDA
ncbi:MAG TPA: hypothetical protein VGC67_12795 [Cellulomonas sp.]